MGYCKGHVCWGELVFPFTHVLATGDMVSYVTQWSIILAVVAVLVLYATSTYW
jgi:hypothetical protein